MAPIGIRQMKLKDALALRPGTEFKFRSTAIHPPRKEYLATVLRVTQDGLMKLHILDGRPWRGPAQFHRENGLVVRWLNCSQVAI